MAGNKLNNTPTMEKPSDNNLATTLVQRGPKDAVTRKDGYGEHVGPLTTQFNSVLNKYIDDTAVSYKSLTAALGLPSINLTNLSGLQKFKAMVDNLHPDKLMKRMEDNVLGGRSLKSIVSTGTTVYKAFKEDAVGALANLSSGVNIGGLNLGAAIKTGRLAYNDARKIHQIVKNGDFSSLGGIIKTLDSIGNNSLAKAFKDIIDVHAVSAFLGSTLKTITAWGDTDLVKAVMAMFKDKKQRNAALSLSLVNAVSRSDISMIRMIIESIGKDALSNYPKIIMMILQSYRFESFASPSDKLNLRRELLDLLNLIDKDWAWGYIAGKKVTKLEPFMNISSDAKSLLRMELNDGYNFTTEIEVARGYIAVDLKQLSMTMYKDITFKNRPLDPRLKI